MQPALNKHSFFLLLFALAALSMPQGSIGAEGDTDTASRKAAVGRVLDSFHAAAAAADGERYLGHFAPGGVFMGTDDWERWPLPAFTDYVKERFAGGTGWVYKAVERNVRLSSDGKLAWFDEITESQRWGRFRGTGVLLREGDEWKIAHYAMSFLVPNERWEAISALAVEGFTERNGNSEATVEDKE
ncbi:MAG: hypothetical protein ACI87W_001377 [Halieaceae bacterium]|jgi:hypothetical protein